MSKGGLAFLNKKSWHTGLPKNIEKTWLAEQAQAKEQEKIKELQLERQQEYELQQLQQLQGTHKKSTHGLDWMYKGIVENHSEKQEQALLGQQTDIKPNIKQEQSKIDSVTQKADDNNTNTILDNKIEQLNRLRDDPLTAIMKSQLQSTGSVNTNAINNTQNSTILELERIQRKLLKETKKLQKQRKKHSKRHRRHSSDDNSDTERDSERQHKHKKRDKSRDGDRHENKRDNKHRYNDERNNKYSDTDHDKHSDETKYRARANSPIATTTVTQTHTAGLQLPGHKQSVQANGLAYGLQPNNSVRHEYTIPNKHNDTTTNDSNIHSHNNYSRNDDRQLSDAERLEQMKSDALQHEQRIQQHHTDNDTGTQHNSKQKSFQPNFVTEINRNMLNQSVR